MSIRVAPEAQPASIASEGSAGEVAYPFVG